MGNYSEKVLLAAFHDRDAAELAVADLENSGFTHEEVGFVLRGSDVGKGGMITDEEGSKDGRGAVAGMAAGAGIGAILGAAAAMLLPGVGPVVAGGVLSLAIGGAAAGTAVGGIFGAIAGLGVSEDEAKFYEQEFHSGKAIVAVRCGDRSDIAAMILRRHGGYDFQSHLNSGADTDVRTEGIFSKP